MASSQLTRQWKVLRSLEASKFGRTAKELAEEVGVQLRTLYRDLDALNEAGFPIYSAEEHRYALMDGWRFNVPPPFTSTELMSLWLYRDLVRVFKGTPFHDDLESLFGKVKATLGPDALSYLDRLQPSLGVGMKPYKEYGRIREILNQVSKALTDRTSLEVAYKPLRTDKEIIRIIDPYHLWYFEGSMYLIAHCQLRGEIRMFVLDRMKLVRTTTDKFTIPKDFDPEEYMQHSFKVMHDDLQEVVVRISPEWARYVGEKIWHQSQEEKWLDDGSLELTFQVAGLDEIKRWVMSMGREAVVVQPKKLLDEIRQEFNLCLKRVNGANAKDDVRTSAFR